MTVGEDVQLVAFLETEPIDGLGAKAGRLEEQPVEQRDKGGQPVVTPADAAVRLPDIGPPRVSDHAHGSLCGD